MAWKAEVTKGPTIEERMIVAEMRLWNEETSEELVLAQELNGSDGPGIKFPGFSLRTEILEAARREWFRFLHAESGRELSKLHKLQLSLAPDCPAAHIWRKRS